MECKEVIKTGIIAALIGFVLGDKFIVNHSLTPIIKLVLFVLSFAWYYLMYVEMKDKSAIICALMAGFILNA